MSQVRLVLYVCGTAFQRVVSAFPGIPPVVGEIYDLKLLPGNSRQVRLFNRLKLVDPGELETFFFEADDGNEELFELFVGDTIPHGWAMVQQ